MVEEVSAVQAKAIWRKWIRAHRGDVALSSKPGQPVFWMRIRSCQISTLVLEESDAAALHRFPAARRLASGARVVLAHRDLHFRRLSRIAVGDKIDLECAGKRTAVYRVNSIRIVLPEEVSAAMEGGQGDNSVYLLTCYPFRYIGAAPKRFLVSAVKVSA